MTVLCWHLSIVPGRRQPSIFDINELNFCVRDGNRWTLVIIDTNYFVLLPFRKLYYNTTPFLKMQAFFKIFFKTFLFLQGYLFP